MADILIKGMEMPDCCNYCVGMVVYAKDTDGVWKDTCKLTGKPIDLDNRNGRPSDCPLVELPPHGDLIDRSKLVIHGWIYDDGELQEHADYYDVTEVQNAPVILEANNGNNS